MLRQIALAWLCLLAILPQFAIAKATLQDRTVKLRSIEIIYIKAPESQENLMFEINQDQKETIVENHSNKWMVQFFNKSNYWKFSVSGGYELSERQIGLLKQIFSESSEIGNFVVDEKTKLSSFTLKKPDHGHYNFEHSVLKDGCFKIAIYPHGIQKYAYEINFCAGELDAAKSFEKYRIILEDKELGKKIFE